MQHLSAITHIRFGLFRVRSPLLTESLLFSFPVGTEMFHFPTFPPTALCVQAEVAGHDSGTSRFPYSEIPGYNACLPAPRGLSQVTTSFFGSWCQGIHRLHLVACQNLQRCSRPLCSSQNTGGTKPTNHKAHQQGPRRTSCTATNPSGPNSVPTPPTMA